jgi:hypothetical protein
MVVVYIYTICHVPGLDVLSSLSKRKPQKFFRVADMLLYI